MSSHTCVHPWDGAGLLMPAKKWALVPRSAHGALYSLLGVGWTAMCLMRVASDLDCPSSNPGLPCQPPWC